MAYAQGVHQTRHHLAQATPRTAARSHPARPADFGIAGGSTQDHLFPGARLLGVWQAHHPERDEQPDQTSEDRYQKRHLKGEVPRLGVDLDDLVLRLLWLAGELFLELGVADHFGVM